MKGSDLNKIPLPELLSNLQLYNDKTAAGPAAYGLTAAKVAELTTLLATYDTSIGKPRKYTK